MERKRTLMVNLLTIAAVLLLVLAALLASRLIPRQIVPNAGPLEIEFEPIEMTQSPETATSAQDDWDALIARKEDIL